MDPANPDTPVVNEPDPEHEHDLLSNIDLSTLHGFGLDRFLPARDDTSGRNTGEDELDKEDGTVRVGPMKRSAEDDQGELGGSGKKRKVDEGVEGRGREGGPDLDDRAVEDTLRDELDDDEEGEYRPETPETDRESQDRDSHHRVDDNEDDDDDDNNSNLDGSEQGNAEDDSPADTQQDQTLTPSGNNPDPDSIPLTRASSQTVSRTGTPNPNPESATGPVEPPTRNKNDKQADNLDKDGENQEEILTPEQRRDKQKDANRLAALRSRGKKRGEL